jgi:amino acid transporter
MTEKLNRSLRLFEVVFFASGVILGAGIYTVIGEAAGFGQNMLWLSFLIASFTALLTAFSYAELCSQFPKAGGEYAYLREGVSKKLAFAVGPLVSATGVLSGATISIGFAGYFAQLFDVNTTITALCIIAIILMVNLVGIRQSSVVNIIFTIIEVLGLLFIVWCGWEKVGEKDLLQLPDEGFGHLMVAGALSFFAFTGFEDAVKLAEETKNPEKNIPRALFIATAIVVCIYMLVVITAVSAVDAAELAESDSPLSLIAKSKYGQVGATIIAVIALFSTANSLLSNMLGGSRIVYNMAEDSSRAKILAKVSKRKTPFVALILIAILTAAFSFIGDIKTIALFCNFVVYTTFIMVNIAVIWIRVKEKKTDQPFRIPFNINNVPVISVLAILMTLIMMAYSIYGLTL